MYHAYEPLTGNSYTNPAFYFIAWCCRRDCSPVLIQSQMNTRGGLVLVCLNKAPLLIHNMGDSKQRDFNGKEKRLLLQGSYTRLD